MTALILAAGAFASAGLAGLFAYIENRLHRADRPAGRFVDVLLILSVVAAVAFALQLVRGVLGW